jgi:dTDP-4-dehydrorhamnose 3,5-epimerase
MKIVSVTPLVMPEVKVIRFARFSDVRGYFTEPFRRSDLDSSPALGFLRGVPLLQMNESWSRKGVIRGLHFQWSPYMGKLVRCVHGRLVDFFLDIRLGSPTFGRIAAYDMTSHDGSAYGEWIWLPPGFAHGAMFPEDSRIEYMCSGEYNPTCEGAISPMAPDLDWSLCDERLRREFDSLREAGPIMSDKDRDAPSLDAWRQDPRAANFVFEPA